MADSLVVQLLAPVRSIRAAAIGLSAGYESICASTTRPAQSQGEPLGSVCIAQTFSTSDGSSSGVVSLHEYPKRCKIFMLEDLIISVDLMHSVFHVFDKETKAYIKSYEHTRKANKAIACISASNDKDSLLFFCYENENKVYCASISSEFCNFYGPIRLDPTGFSSSSKIQMSNFMLHPSKSWIFIFISGKLVAYNYSNLKKRLNKLETKEDGDNEDNNAENEAADDGSDTASVQSGASSRFNSNRSQQSRVSSKSVWGGSSSSSKNLDFSNRIVFVSGKDKFDMCAKIGFNKNGSLVGVSWSSFIIDSKSGEHIPADDIVTVYDIESPSFHINAPKLSVHGTISPIVTIFLASSSSILSPHFTNNTSLNPAIRCHSISFHPTQPVILVSVSQTIRNSQSGTFLVPYSMLQNGALLNAAQSLQSLFPLVSTNTSDIIDLDMNQSSISLDDIFISHVSELVLITAKQTSKSNGQESQLISICKFSDIFVDRFLISSLICNHYYTHPDVFLFGDSVLDMDTQPSKPNFKKDKNLASAIIHKNLMRSKILTIKPSLRCNLLDGKGEIFDLSYTVYLGNLGLGLSLSSEDQKEKEASQESSREGEPSTSSAISSSNAACAELLTLSKSTSAVLVDWIGLRGELLPWTKSQSLMLKSVKCVVGLANPSKMSEDCAPTSTASAITSSKCLYSIIRGCSLDRCNDMNRDLPVCCTPITGLYRYTSHGGDPDNSFAWFSLRDADFFTGLEATSQPCSVDKPLGFLCICSDRVTLKWILFPSSVDNSATPGKKGEFEAIEMKSWRLPCPMARVWTSEVGAPNITLYLSEPSPALQNCQAIFASTAGDPSLSDSSPSLLLHPGEFVSAVVWQPIPSSFSTRADKASSSEKNIQSIWLKSSSSVDPLVGILTNMRVIIVNNKLVIVNECKYNVVVSTEGHDLASSSLCKRGNSGGFEANASTKYHMHNQNAVSSIAWVGRSLMFSESNNGRISYLLPYRDAKKFRFDPISNQATRFGSSNKSHILCHIDSYVASHGMLLVSCLPDRLIFMTKVNSETDTYSSSIAMVTRPCLPSEPLILGLLEMASIEAISPSESNDLSTINLSSPRVIIEAMLTAIVTQYYSHQSQSTQNTQESQIKPTSHASTVLCQALSSWNFPILAAATAGLPLTVPQGGLSEFPTIRWIHSNMKFFIGLDADGIECASASFITQKYDWFEKFIDPDSFGGSLSHSMSPASKQCSALARLLFTFGKFDYARRFSDIAGDDSLLALLLALNQKEVISPTPLQTPPAAVASTAAATTSPGMTTPGVSSSKGGKEAGVTALTPSPLGGLAPPGGAKLGGGLLSLPPGAGTSGSKRSGLLSGGLPLPQPSLASKLSSKTAMTAGSNDGDKNAKKLVSDDMNSFFGALDNRNIRLKDRIQEMIKQIGENQSNAYEARDTFLPNDAFNCTRRNVLLSVGKPFYFKKDMHSDSLARNNSLLKVAPHADSNQSPLQSIYDGGKTRATYGVPIGVSGSINKFFSFNNEKSSWRLGRLAMDSSEDWLGLKIKPEGINVSKSSEKHGMDNFSSNSPSKGGTAASSSSSDKSDNHLQSAKSKYWIDGIGQGKEHDKVSGYWRLSDMSLVGEEGFVSTKLPGSRCCFTDLSKFLNPLELFCADASDLVVEETSSNTDPGDDHEKVKGLNDIVFMKDSISESDGSATITQGLRVSAGRGNSIDTGLMHTDADRCKQTVELNAKLSLIGLSAQTHIVLLRRVLADESKFVFSLVLNESGYLQFYIGNSKGSSNSDTNLVSSDPVNVNESKMTDWLHIALTIDSSQFDGNISVQVYLNGEKCMKGSLSISSISESDLSDSTLYFCSRITATSRLTELRVWSDVRTSSEVDENKENYLSLASKRKRQLLRVKGANELFTKVRSSFKFGEPSAALVVGKASVLSKVDGKDETASTRLESNPTGTSKLLPLLPKGGLNAPNTSTSADLANDSAASSTISITATEEGAGSNSAAIANTDIKKVGSLGLPKPGGMLLPPSKIRAPILPLASTTTSNTTSSYSTSTAATTLVQETSVETTASAVLGDPFSPFTTASLESLSSSSSHVPLIQKLKLHKNSRSFPLKNDVRSSYLQADGVAVSIVSNAPDATAMGYLANSVIITRVVEGRCNLIYKCADITAESAVVSPIWIENGVEEHLYIMIYSSGKITFFTAKLPIIEESSKAIETAVLECRKVHEYPLETLVFWTVSPLFRLYLVTSNTIGMYILPSGGGQGAAASMMASRPTKIADRNDLDDITKWKTKRVWDLSESASGNVISIVSTAMDLEFNPDAIVTSVYSVPKADKSNSLQINISLRAIECSFSRFDSSDENVLIMWCKNSSFKKLVSPAFEVTSVKLSTLQRLCSLSTSSSQATSSTAASYRTPGKVNDLLTNGNGEANWSVHLEDLSTGGLDAGPNTNALMRINRLGNALFQFDSSHNSVVFAQPHGGIIIFNVSTKDGAIIETCKVSLASLPLSGPNHDLPFNPKISNVLISCVQSKRSKAKTPHPFSIHFATNSGEIWTLFSSS